MSPQQSNKTIFPTTTPTSAIKPHDPLTLSNIQSSTAVLLNYEWVEVEISLHTDARAELVYKVKFNVLPNSSPFHGIYMTKLPEIQSVLGGEDRNYAILEDNTTVPLSITYLEENGQYDIVLANGRSVEAGNSVIFVITFLADFFHSGHIARTYNKQYGELIVFNWAPIQWDQRISDHETVIIHFPIEVPGQAVSNDFVSQIKFLTDERMNEQYNLSTYGFYDQLSQKYWFTWRAHKQGPLEAYYKMQILIFFSPSVLSLPFSQPLWVVLLGISLILIFFVIGMGFYGYSQRTIKSVHIWKKVWEPPKLLMPTVRKQGKIPELDPIEAAYLLGKPTPWFIALILYDLQYLGAITVENFEPLRISIHWNKNKWKQLPITNEHF